MEITAYQNAITQGKTVDFCISIKKLGCLGMGFFIGIIIFFSLIFLVSIALFIIYGIGPVLEASSDARGGGAIGSMFVSGMILFLIIWTAFLHPAKLLSVNKKGLTIYDKLSDALSKKNPSIFIPWHEILDMNTEIVKEKFARRTSCIVLKCTTSTLQKIQQHRKQFVDELSKIGPVDKRLYYQTYDIIDDMVKINISSYLIITAPDLLTFFQKLHKDAITAQQ